MVSEIICVTYSRSPSSDEVLSDTRDSRFEYTFLLLWGKEEYQLAGDLVDYSETAEVANTVIVASMVVIIAETSLVRDRTEMGV